MLLSIPYVSELAYLIGTVGAVIALVAILREATPAHRRLIVGCLVAMALASGPVLAAVIFNQCSEDALRRLYGDGWEVMWWLLGCWAM